MKPASKIETFLRDQCGASEQAIEKIEIYVRMLTEWQAAINLVAPSTLPHIWERHILDSAQIYPLIRPGEAVIDLGSGGGLPAILLAILGAEHVTMIESDQRKCVFLREVSRETSLGNVTILNKRLEQVDSIKASVVTARALASLSQLVAWATPLLAPQGRMVFLKGQDYQAEIDVLSGAFNGKIDLIQSITDDKAKIVVLQNP